jgi:phage terminase small subunit
LNDRQEQFCAHYIATGTATEAAKRAGYSEKTAYSIGQRLLKNVEIQNRVKSHVEEAIITADEVLNGIKAIAINGESETAQLKAYELLGKHLKLFTDKSEVSGPNGGPQEHVIKGVQIELTDD